MKNIFLLIFVLICLTSCGRDQAAMKLIAPEVTADAAVELQRATADEKAVATEVQFAPPNKSASEVSKKVIKEGEISFEARDLSNSRNSILSALKNHGGYVSEENQSNNSSENRQEIVLKVRVPAGKFDAFIEAISSSASHVDYKNIRITDVTTRYIDLTTRLNNQKLLENRYKALLGKAGKMSDILDIEAKLNEIRTDIESNQGQLNYLNKQVAYSALDITFYTKRTEVNTGNGFGYRIKTALSDGWYILQNIFFGLITLWPVVLVLILLIWLFRRWRKRRRESKVRNQ